MSRLAPTLPTRRPACLRASRLAALAAVVVGLSGCAAMTAQNPSGALRPVNAVADNVEFKSVVEVVVAQDRKAESLIMFDPDHSWDERILAEQFKY